MTLATNHKDGGVLRRNAKGCKSVDFNAWPEEPFEEMESTLAVQQYIQQKIKKDASNIDEILTPPKGQDLGIWKYEHMRQFCLELNRLTVRLQAECSPETCSQMSATEQWIFLCAAHKAPKECPAIDYTRHTLDGAASLLNSNKYFPSRVTIKESSVAKLASICRRVYRIFSHAYYHHKVIYDEFESKHFLCKRFSLFSLKYDLMSADNLIVPIPGVDFNALDGSKKVDATQANGEEAATESDSTSIVEQQQQQPDTCSESSAAATNTTETAAATAGDAANATVISLSNGNNPNEASSEA